MCMKYFTSHLIISVSLIKSKVCKILLWLFQCIIYHENLSYVIIAYHTIPLMNEFSFEPVTCASEHSIKVIEIRRYLQQHTRKVHMI